MKHRVLLCLTLALAFTGCDKPVVVDAPTSPPAAVLPAAYKVLAPDEVEQLIATTPPLGILDMRQEEEIHDGNGWIANATPCPYFSDYRSALQKLDRGQPWLVYCAIGGRAEYTAATMAQLGFQRVYLIKGGFNAWRAAGKPVVK